MKLAGKFILALVLGIWLILGIRAYLGVRSEISLFEAGLMRDHHAFGISLALAVKQLRRFADQEGVFQVVEEINREKTEIGIRWIWLDAPPGDIRGASLGEDRRSALLLGKAVDWIDPQLGPAGSLLTYIPVLTEGERPAAIELIESLEQGKAYRDEAIRNSLLTALAFLAAYAALVAGIGIWFVGRPVQRLIEKIRRVGRGDLSGTLVLRQRDELSELAREFNSMCEGLSAAREKVAAETAARIATIEQLRHADRLVTVGKLAAGIAHELGSPLNVALARIKMIRSLSLKPEAVNDNCQIAIEQLDRMTKIIRQLLDFARPHAPKKMRIDLVQGARHTIELLDPMARKAKVSLVLGGGEAPVLAEVDPYQFQQVLSNLLVNAIQAMREGGKAVVDIRRVRARPPSRPGGPESIETESICVSVQDEGTGIFEESLLHLFEPFFTTKKAGEGTGLGLSVSYGIVREHGGWIEVESTVGKGSRFNVYFPVGDVHEGTGSDRR